MKNIYLNCSWIKLLYIKKMSVIFKNIFFKKVLLIFYLLEKNYKIWFKWYILFCESFWFYLFLIVIVYFLFLWWFIICVFLCLFLCCKIIIYRIMFVVVCYYKFFILEKIKIVYFLYVKKKFSINDYWFIVWFFLYILVI